MARRLKEYDIYIDGKYFRTQKIHTSPVQIQNQYKLLSLSNDVTVVQSSQSISSDEEIELNPHYI
jgi:hypothetical protein